MAMRVVDRVMRAYSRTHKLTDEQHQQVRGELAKFIRELMLGGQSAEVRLEEMQQVRQDASTGETI
jgi:flagellar hook-basal body complex protein FliE